MKTLLKNVGFLNSNADKKLLEILTRKEVKLSKALFELPAYKIIKL